MPPRRSESPPTPPKPSGDLLNWPTPLACALIFLVTLVAFWPALGGGFIWDDSGHVTRADLQSLHGLGRIWFEFGATQQYYPLLHSAFWLEHRVWGDSAVCYHLFNLLLHATAACLFGVVLRRLAVPGAWLAALLFALHPVAVETVAWIAEQKNTLSAVLYLCAALAYLRFDAERRWAQYALATALFAAALLTKTVTATLPPALLVVFWWQRGRLSWRRDVLPLLPWFAMGAAMGLVTAYFERKLIGAEGTDFALSAIERGLLAGRVFWFYLGKLIWPAKLIFVYPRWTVDVGELWQWLFPLGGLGLLGGLVWWRTRSRGPLAAALLFGGALFPVLGFVNVYPFIFSFVADHFQYLASLPLFALVGVGLTRAAARLPRRGGLAAAAGLLLLLGGLSWSQSGMYHDGLTLFQTTVDRNPDAWLAHNNLAVILTESGRVDEAVPHLEQVLRIRPGDAGAESNLGDDLTRLGRPLEAIPHLEKALKAQPDYAEAHFNLGNALVSAGRPAEGMNEYQQALRCRPTYAEAERAIGLALASAGQTAEALPHFVKAVSLRPDYAEAELSWGIALLLTDHFDEAVPHFEKANALDPNSADSRNAYGRALARRERFGAAIVQFEDALRLNPELADAHMNLALVLRQVGRMDEATRHYSEAVRLNPALGGSAPP